MFGASQGPPQLGRQPSVGFDGRVGSGRLARFLKPLRRLCPKGAGAPWQQLARPERDAGGLARHRQVLQALRVQLPLGDFDGSYASRDGLVAVRICLIARLDLLYHGSDSQGLRRRLGDRTVRAQDLVDRGVRTAGPTSVHCVRGGATHPQEVHLPSRRPRSPFLNRATTELNHENVDQIQIGTLISTFALLLQSPVTSARRVIDHFLLSL